MSLAAKPETETKKVVELRKWRKQAAQNGPAATKKKPGPDAALALTLRYPPDVRKELDAAMDKLGMERTAIVMTALRRQLKLLTNKKACDEFKLESLK